MTVSALVTTSARRKFAKSPLPEALLRENRMPRSRAMWAAFTKFTDSSRRLSSPFSSATVIGLLGNYQDWIAPYGLGLLAGFLFYLVLSIILIATGLFEKLANVGILSKTLLGAPRE